MKIFNFIVSPSLVFFFLVAFTSPSHSSREKKEPSIIQSNLEDTEQTEHTSSQTKLLSQANEESKFVHHSRVASFDAMLASSSDSCINEELEIEKSIDTRNWESIRSFLSMLSWPHLQSLHHFIQDGVHHPNISLSFECSQSLLHFINGIDNHETWAFKGELFTQSLHLFYRVPSNSAFSFLMDSI
jgi:hypothetical protein